MNAFQKYLLTLSDEAAADHLHECLMDEDGEAAHELMAEINGRKWSVRGDKYREFLLNTVRELRKRAA